MIEKPETSLDRMAIEGADASTWDEGYFRHLADAMPQIVFITDAAGNVEYYNQYWYRYTGLPPGTYRREDWIAAVHPEDLLLLLGRRASDLTNDALFEAAYRLRRWDGVYRWHLGRGVPIKDAAGTVVKRIGAAMDITEQKTTAQNLRFLAEASKTLSSSLDYRATLATVAQLGVPEIADWCAVDMLSDTGAIEQLAVAHVDPEKVRWARELNRANPPDPNALTGVPNVLRTGKSEFYPMFTDAMLVTGARNAEELALIRRIGFSSAMIVPLRVHERTIGALTFVTAESGRHYSEADLAFAEEVANRAALAVENARLYAEAQRAIATRDEFMSLAAHELKTPVTSLKMYTQVFQRQAERGGDTAAAERFDKMDRQIDKLTGLINDLLNVARIQGGRLDYVDAPVDLNAVVHDTVEMIRPTTDRHGIEVVGSVDGRVVGDSERLGQVLTNLLTNAIKYSPHANRIVVRLGVADGMARVSVQDFGIGIAPEQQTRIFEQFYRASDPFEKTYPGLGLGLYIANEIVKRHGGTIAVQSEQGKGATFTVSLPLLPDDGTKR